MIKCECGSMNPFFMRECFACQSPFDSSALELEVKSLPNATSKFGQGGDRERNEFYNRINREIQAFYAFWQTDIYSVTPCGITQDYMYWMIHNFLFTLIHDHNASGTQMWDQAIEVIYTIDNRSSLSKRLNKSASRMAKEQHRLMALDVLSDRIKKLKSDLEQIEFANVSDELKDEERSRLQTDLAAHQTQFLKMMDNEK